MHILSHIHTYTFFAKKVLLKTIQQSRKTGDECRGNLASRWLMGILTFTSNLKIFFCIIMNSWILCKWCVLNPFKYYCYSDAKIFLVFVTTPISHQDGFMSIWIASVVFDSFLVFWYNIMPLGWSWTSSARPGINYFSDVTWYEKLYLRGTI